MTVQQVIRTAGKLTALEPVFIALPVNSVCEVLGSRENATNKFRVVFTPPRLLCAILRDDFQLDNLGSRNSEAGIVGRGESGPLAWSLLFYFTVLLFVVCVLCCNPTKSAVGPEVQEQLSATQCYGDWTHQWSQYSGCMSWNNDCNKRILGPLVSSLKIRRAKERVSKCRLEICS